MEPGHSLSPVPIPDISQGVSVFLTVGGEKGVGHFLLAGNEEEVAKLGPK